MLIELHIRDFAVIESLDLEFHQGMTVFTGETGAGKSIIVDAMGLILGDRGDSSIVRHGQDKTELTARFTINNNAVVHSILNEQDIEYDDELMIRRVINKEGRSRAFVNGTPCPIQLLRSLGEQLVDIHGQHAHQSLLRKDNQQQLLDRFGAHESLLSDVNDHYSQWHELQQQLQKLNQHDAGREAHLTLLRYQVEELETLALEDNEVPALEKEFKRLANASRLRETVEEMLNDFSDSTADASLLDKINRHRDKLNELKTDDDSLSSISNLLTEACVQLEEAVHESRHYLDQIQLDPERFANVENRLSLLHDMARKHQVKVDTLPEHYQHLANELADLEGGEQRYQELTKQASETETAYRQAANKLHKSRVSKAKKLGEAIVEKLKLLGMEGGQFEVKIDYEKEHQPQKNGLDKIEFLVSANPGQDLKPIGKVASGGELSRISLAIQVISQKDKTLPTFVFDEVDAGIGGATADIVGQLLHSLTVQNQIFCVTHLPQVARYGDQHFHVSKIAGNNVTRTQVRQLEENNRVEEIARMMGGAKITEQSLAHAREMLDTKQAKGKN